MEKHKGELNESLKLDNKIKELKKLEEKSAKPIAASF
jgi:hypothetical protein